MSKPDKSPHTDSPGFFSAFVEGRRAEILDAALDVFTAKSYETGTMRDIARRVGVSEPAIYRYYDSKEALFIDLIALTGKHLVINAAAQFFSAVEPDTLLRSLTGFLKSRRDGLPKGGPLLVSTLLMAAPNRPEFREAMDQNLRAPLIELISQFIARMDAAYGMERSEAQVRGRARAFMSTFVGYFVTMRAFDEGGNPPVGTDEAIAEAIIAMMGWPGGSTGSAKEQVSL